MHRKFGDLDLWFVRLYEPTKTDRHTNTHCNTPSPYSDGENDIRCTMPFYWKGFEHLLHIFEIQKFEFQKVYAVDAQKMTYFYWFTVL